VKGDITFGGDITDLWGGHHRPKQNVYKISLGGTSPTFGGDITDLWGGHHRPKHPSMPQKTWFFLPLNLF
jgi:hypothetical protein